MPDENGKQYTDRIYNLDLVIHEKRVKITYYGPVADLKIIPVALSGQIYDETCEYAIIVNQQFIQFI